MRVPLLSVALTTGVIGVDALSKVWTRSALGEQTVPLLPGLVLHVTENLRGPFGLGPLWLAVCASIVVLLVVVRRPFSILLFPHSAKASHFAPGATRDRSRGRPFSIRSAALALLLGGGLANLGERLLFGRTTDLVVLGSLAALNVADLAILAGLVWLLVSRFGRR